LVLSRLPLSPTLINLNHTAASLDAATASAHVNVFRWYAHMRHVIAKSAAATTATGAPPAAAAAHTPPPTVTLPMSPALRVQHESLLTFDRVAAAAETAKAATAAKMMASTKEKKADSRLASVQASAPGAAKAAAGKTKTPAAAADAGKGGGGGGGGGGGKGKKEKKVKEPKKAAGGNAAVVASAVFVVGVIASAAAHPDDARLAVVQVDVGGGDTVQTVCGAGGILTTLTSGAKTVVWRNIKGATIKGVESQSRILLSQDADGARALVTPPADAAAGAAVTVAGVAAAPVDCMSAKKVSALLKELKIVGGAAVAGDAAFETSAGGVGGGAVADGVIV
jgi:tRNA-binding EMAP/Myf-like protein